MSIRPFLFFICCCLLASNFCLSNQLDDLKAKASKGDAQAQFELAELLALGHHSEAEPNIKEAIDWYTQAADKGHVQAQFTLGWLYFSGGHIDCAVAKDFAKSAEWFQKAAAQNHAKSQYLLGTMYASGLGVTKNKIEAYVWLALAERQHYPGASVQRIAREMSPSEIEKAKSKLSLFK